MSAAFCKQQTGSSKVIFLRGNYGEGNYGDDALAIAAQQLLIPHSGSIVTDGELAYRDQRLLGVRCGDTLDESLQAIVYGGGTQFFSFEYDVPTSAPTQLPRRVLRKLVRPMTIIDSYRARRRHWIESRTPQLAIGFGVGPFSEGSAAEADAAKLLKAMDLVWVRDDASMAFCKRHDIETAVQSSDLCFTSAFADAVRKPARGLGRANDCKQVGIILRDWKAWDETYFDAAIEAARRLRKLGVGTKFISLAPSDTRFLASLERHGESVISWRCTPDSFEIFWDTFAQMDLIVTSRFHGAVFAALSETPFLAIGIEPKLEQVKTWVQASDWPETIIPATSDPELFTRQVLSALSEIGSRGEAVRAMVLEQHRLAAVGERRLIEYFEERAEQ